MSLEIPKYVPIDAISQHDVQHEWDDYDPVESPGWPDEATKRRLKKITTYGLVAFAIGCAEWVVYRFSRLSSDKSAYDYLEAFWMFEMGIADAFPEETVDEEWRGPIRGPMDLAFRTIMNTFLLSEKTPAVSHGAFAAQIALHVLEDKRPFLEWQGKVLSRLEKYCVRTDEDPDGQPVPRELLDPDFDLESILHEELIRDFISRTDFKSNPELSHVQQ